MNVTNYAMSQILWQNLYYNDSPLENSENKIKDYLLKINPLLKVKKWLDSVKVKNSNFAHFLCRLIPTQCPFQRQIKLWGKTIITIPPLCKINPIYDELMFLRFRAMSYLVDECGEDVNNYI